MVLQVSNIVKVYFAGYEEENDQPPPLEKIEPRHSEDICDNEDLGGLGEALLKEIALAVQVQGLFDRSL